MPCHPDRVRRNHEGAPIVGSTESPVTTVLIRSFENDLRLVLDAFEHDYSAPDVREAMTRLRRVIN
jgi:hypothetical protein